ncbi:serine hydrolase domain-containing protein [Amycolatopsis saalfeldensis]|uniref:CubicO group peptidase, beta-lactamase class C family n=1 Tax=Amycolatopsis saalfeldensis TaxID=394193 RepID=A0A1H8XNE2_9PSEU|nr:serine hydrolase domain-containing protein [Amycolatopsis saalfeldensis]SEP40808.1 CubicO group peptidase, beta-lactamase class C family [Amycolatopsis saalfeldensis]
MTALHSLRDRIAGILDGQSPAGGVAGAVIGVAVGGDQFSLAHGCANLNTGQEFSTDTGWLLGSVTKVLTTTLLLRLVDAGLVDLDAPARRYLPEFTLADADAAEAITVRMLVNHTNGIDADELMPSAVRGRDATRSYVQELAGFGCVFEPGAGVHYSNPGFVLAARIIETCTGLPYERAIQAELFDVCGMADATAVQTQAFLRPTAIGAFSSDEPGKLRATTLFSLPESAAGAGGTPIVTVADMIAFGRMHLAGGLAPDGRRVLSEELVVRMRTESVDLGLPQTPPMGLGWWLDPIAGTTAAWHGGGSPGGTSSFCIVPEHDAVIVTFVSGPNSLLNDTLHTSVIEHLTARPATPPFTPAPASAGPEMAGEYAAFHRSMRTSVHDGDLLVRTTIPPYTADPDLDPILAEYGVPSSSTATYTAVAPGLFLPDGMDPRDTNGFYGRIRLLADLPAAPGRPRGIHTGLRFIPKVG